MPIVSASFQVHEERIDDIAITSDRLTGRGGLALFSRYLSSIDIFPHMERLFGSMRRSKKGLVVSTLFKQLFCFFFDGTSSHLVYFDHLSRDAGYAAAIETKPVAMASSHQIKRFFGAFSWYRMWLFRRLLQHLFLWRLQQEKPNVVIFGIDTMVMDNSESDVRHGVEPTYKKGVKGFQPLQVTWGRFIVDAVFRGGSKHSNYGDTVAQTITYLVQLVRTRYRDAPIVFRMDSGFFDQKLMELCEDLEVGYIVGGRLYEDIVEQADSAPHDAWWTYRNAHQEWQYLEMADSRSTWKQYRRCIFTRTTAEHKGQRLLDFATTQSIIYTNLDPKTALGQTFITERCGWVLSAEAIVKLYHDRGSDELVHRALKDFRVEALPFKRFAANAAFYYTCLVAFFLYEAFKEDVCRDIVKISSYVTRVRRQVIDIAAKIVRTGHRTILKVSSTIYYGLDIAVLWQRVNAPPRFTWQQ